MPEKGRRIRVVPLKEARKGRIVFLVIAALFVAATVETKYNPLEFLFNMKNFWLFIFEDLVPPKVSDWHTILKSLGQTFAMAVAATFVSSIVSLVLAFLGSYTTAPWKPMKKIIRFIASIGRNIPSMIWVFILIMAFGIGNIVGVLALLIATCGLLTRSFIEVIDEVGAESLESMRAVGAGRLATITQVIVPASLPGFVSWLMYGFEVNIRSSTLVGAVGGGGIGLLMTGFIKQFRYHSAMGVILLVAGTVILVDILTNYLRKKVLS